MLQSITTGVQSVFSGFVQPPRISPRDHLLWKQQWNARLSGRKQSPTNLFHILDQERAQLFKEPASEIRSLKLFHLIKVEWQIKAM